MEMKPVCKIYEDETKQWILGNVLHRKDGPAIIQPNGIEEWYVNGERHRDDGPAVIWPNGQKDWYLNGKLHRKDGPAIEYPSGTKEWYLHGEYHREDGPAVEYSNGRKDWYLNDFQYTLEEYISQMNWSDAEKVEFYLKWKQSRLVKFLKMETKNGI